MLKFKDELRRSVLYFVKKMPWKYQDGIYYLFKFKQFPNIHSPKLFNEKVLYRKFINGDYLRYGRLADKYFVRDHVAKTIGEKYLIPLIHETSDPATLLSLPSWKNTVIKPNHGSNMVEILLEEPDAQQKQRIINRCNVWLHKDFSCESREIHYRYIQPRILVEQYIGDGHSLPIDYKFHMFNQRDGRFEYVLQVIYNRSNPDLSMNFYVNNLHDVFYKIRDTGLDISAEEAALRTVLELSKTLASEFDYVRVDWYLRQGQIYFGELTFTPCAGLMTGLDVGLNQMMGQMWIQQHDIKKLAPVGNEDVPLPTMPKKV